VTNQERLAVSVKLIQARQAHRGRASTTNVAAARDTEAIDALLWAAEQALGSIQTATFGGATPEILALEACQDFEAKR
jgi:hypothetical protein